MATEIPVGLELYLNNVIISIRLQLFLEVCGYAYKTLLVFQHN